MPQRFPDRAIVRFPPGMLARVRAVLCPGEDRGAFILAATALRAYAGLAKSRTAPGEEGGPA
jgi:hypothetical protein